MLKTVNIYTCDICGKRVTVEDGRFPEDMLNSIELEETVFCQAHTTKWDHVCKKCISEIRKTIKRLEEVENEQN